MIKFNKASITQLEEKYLLDALHGNVLSGDGKYTDMAYEELGKRFGFERMLLTTSGTASLEMASILSRIEPGDEVIVPSFTFSSTVNAFLLRGARPVFCDIRPDTCNIDEMLIEELITREQHPAPKFWLNPEIKDFYAFTEDDVRLDDYEHGPQIKDIPIAV